MKKNNDAVYMVAGMVLTILLQMFCGKYIMFDAISFIITSVIYMFLFTGVARYMHEVIFYKDKNNISLCLFYMSSIILIATISIGTRGNVKEAGLNFFLCLIALIVFLYSIHSIKLNKETVTNIKEA